MADSKPRVTWAEVAAEQQRQEAAGAGQLSGLPFVGAAAGGPQPAQEAAASARQARGLVTPGQAVAPVEEAVQSVAADAQAEGRKMQEHPYSYGLPMVGSMLLAPVGSKVAPVARLLRFTSGQPVRAGSPILMAGARLMDRALFSGLGAAGGAEAGRELDRPPGSPAETTPERLKEDLWMAAVGGGAEVAAPVAAGTYRAAKALRGTVGRAVRGEYSQAGQYFLDQLLARGRTPKVVPMAEEVQASLRARGTTALPEQLFTAEGYQTLGNMLDKSILGRWGRAATREEATAAAWDNWREALPAWGRDLTDVQIGKVLDDAIKGAEVAKRTGGNLVLPRGTQAKDMAVDHAYSYARSLANSRGVADDVVPVDGIVKYLFNDTALLAARDAGDEFAVGIYNTINKLVDPGAVPILKAGQGRAYQNITFQQAEAIRSTLNKMAYSDKKSIVAGSEKFAVPYAKLFDEAMDGAATALNVPEVRNAYLAARDLSKEKAETFGNDVIGTLLAPERREQITQAIIRANNPSSVAAVYRVLDDPQYQQAVINAVKPFGGTSVQDFKDMLVNRWFARIEERGGQRESTTADIAMPAAPAALAGAPAKTEIVKEGSGQRMMELVSQNREMFEALVPDPVQRRNYEVLLRAIQVTQSRAKAGGVLSLAFQFSQLGTAAAALNMLRTGFTVDGVASAGFVVLPKAISSFADAGPVVDWMLRRAISMPKSGRLVGAAGARWAAASTAEYIDRLRRSNIPFTYVSPTGEQTSFTPDAGVQGQYNPNPHKPQSKTGPGGTQ